ncbi:MAG: radical SAM protein [Magnetococcales bacterium]|nr:radical SAM protein [Magnetococcales bacterium]MBF0323046.1 radical SAM protein [Magnetococcales bacterium]
MLTQVENPLPADNNRAPSRDRIGGGKLQDNHDLLEQWLAGEEPGPLTIEVALVLGCNHGCLHCAPRQFDLFDPHKSFMDTEVFQKFLVEFRDMGGEEVYFAGAGEPLLHPHFADFMALGHKIGLRMTFSSNGVLLNEANAEKILPHTTWVRFSVNGGNAETYTRVHDCHARDYDRLIRNLENARDQRKNNQWQVHLALQFVVFEENWPSIPGMVALHEHLGTDKLIFRNRFDKEGYKHPVHPDALPLLEKAARVKGVEIRWGSFPREGEIQQAAWRRCDGIHFRTNMDHQGNLFACGRQFYKDSRFGDIHAHSLQEIWHAEKRRRLFAEIGKGGDIPLCGRLCPTSFDNIYIEKYMAEREHGGNSHKRVADRGRYT